MVKIHHGSLVAEFSIDSCSEATSSSCVSLPEKRLPGSGFQKYPVDIVEECEVGIDFENPVALSQNH